MNQPQAGSVGTHYCVICAARWTKHKDGTWGTRSPVGPCCDNVPMDNAPIVGMTAGAVNGSEADHVKREYWKAFFTVRPNERDLIVAWLRQRADSVDALAGEMTDERGKHDAAIMAKARRIEADAIERGEHLQVQP